MNPELEVPTIDQRERIPERVIQAMARLIGGGNLAVTVRSRQSGLSSNYSNLNLI